MARAVTPEGALQKTILDYLAAKHVLAFRMNTGAVKTESRFFRFGVPGMADILAFLEDDPTVWCTCGLPTMISNVIPVWIEVKAERGQQSAFQKSFQKQVEEAGHRYILAKSLEDVEAAL